MAFCEVTSDAKIDYSVGLGLEIECMHRFYKHPIDYFYSHKHLFYLLFTVDISIATIILGLHLVAVKYNTVVPKAMSFFWDLTK